MGHTRPTEPIANLLSFQLSSQRLAALALALGLITTAGLPLNAAEPDTPDAVITAEDALEYQLIEKIKTAVPGKSDYDREIKKRLKDFYLENDRKTVWLGDNGLTPTATKALAAIKNGPDWALNVNDIPLPDESMIKGSAEARADAELMISRAFITYAQRAKGGNLVPTKISRFLDNHPEYPDPKTVLETILKADNPGKALNSFQPKHPQFWALKKQLDKLRNNEKKKKAQVKIPNGNLIRPFDRHPHVVLLRERLDKPVPVKNGKALFPEDIYDSALITAVKNFQAANGLKKTGLVNRSTRTKLNHNSDQMKKDKILANMERWRWMPTSFGNFNIRVNIPEFMVRVTRNNKVIHKERVITGKRSQKTPSFSDEMETVVFNPYWNVPQSIIWNEMGGVAPKGYESRVVNGRIYIRQPPGNRNALGRVKFLFPNKHSVYLHDTPTKNLFNRTTRAFSHGCMRLRDPMKMAEIVLAKDGYSRKKINAIVASYRNTPIQLTEKIATHVTYFTVHVNDDGSMSHYNDIYGHDKRVLAALNGKPMGLEPKQRINRVPLYMVEKKKKKKQEPVFFNLFFN